MPPCPSVVGGGGADHHDQPDVHNVPSLYEEKIRIPDSAPQHPLLSPGGNSPGLQSFKPRHRPQPARKYHSNEHFSCYTHGNDQNRSLFSSNLVNRA